jgi:hypothetical protein
MPITQFSQPVKQPLQNMTIVAPKVCCHYNFRCRLTHIHADIVEPIVSLVLHPGIVIDFTIDVNALSSPLIQNGMLACTYELSLT